MKNLKNIDFRFYINNFKNLPVKFIFFSILSFSFAYLINLFIEYKYFSLPKPIFNIKGKGENPHQYVNTSFISELFKKREKNKGKILVISNNVKLVGILWIGNQKFALVELNNRKKRLVKKGDFIGTGKIIKIGSFYIEIEDEEGIKRIYINVKGKMRRNRFNNFREKYSSSDVKEVNLRKLNINKNIFSLMKNITIRPYNVNGKKGLLIESVSDTTLVEALGIKEGDIIISINGMPIKDEATFVNNLISTINSGKPIEIVLLRNGKEERIRYNGALFR